uniref:Uncharacterized protein n=1 Tax=Ceratitis capitata TaxID=7213 RepID=W8BRJ8_CERCA
MMMWPSFGVNRDGALCHTAKETNNLLKEALWCAHYPHCGPPRSCNLTALDYFVWGYVKSLVYADKREMITTLEGNIRRVIADIRHYSLQKVVENSTTRLDLFKLAAVI